MADIFREVDEDVRSDRLGKAWSRYSILVYGAAAAIVIATAAVTYMRHERTAAAEASGAKFAAAQDLAKSGKPAEAEAAFTALAKDSPAGVRALALLRAAQEQGLSDRAGAVKALDTLAADAAVPPLLQDVARLRAGLLRADAADKAELENRLGPLLERPLPRHRPRTAGAGGAEARRFRGSRPPAGPTGGRSRHARLDAPARRGPVLARAWRREIFAAARKEITINRHDPGRPRRASRDGRPCK